MKYVGVGVETGNEILEENAFMYAMERCTTDYAEDFSNNFRDVDFSEVSNVIAFRSEVVEWFYSGNWISK